MPIFSLPPTPSLVPIFDSRSGKIPVHSVEGVEVTPTHRGLRLVFPASRASKITLKIPNGGDRIGGVALRFSKMAGPDTWNSMFVGQDGHPGLVEAGGWISQGQHFWLVFGAKSQPNIAGLGYNPPVDGPTGMAASYQDHTKVDFYGLQFSYPTQPVTILVEEAMTTGPVSWKSLIDRWGQSNLKNWSGKIKSDDDLRARLAEEESRIAANPTMPDTDEFGGWTGGPQLEATGRFRVAQHQGKWAFVTPTGRLFLSIGQNNITFDEGTVTQGRNEMFDWLPEKADPLAKYYGKAGLVLAGPAKEGWQTYDFAQANAHRHFGESWKENFWSLTERRLKHWGFNTLANWTDRELSLRRTIPYTATTAIWGTSRQLFGAPDPFNPAFEQDLRNDLKNWEFAKNDPWCLGIFVDNEINWGSGSDGPGRIFYFRAALDAGPDIAAKRRLLGFAQDRYASISLLNNAWGTTYSDWDALLNSKVNLSDSQLARPEIKADGIQFSRLVYRQYFRTVRRVLNEALPGTLYLGPRFHAWTPDAAEIAADYCDVVSFNVYSPELGAAWTPSPDWKHPMLIGEFGFRGRDTGFFNRTATDALTQKEKGEKMAQFWRSAMSRPEMVGLHWFRYRDQSVLGRVLDGENANFGFIAITNTVYPEMEGAARRLTSRMYSNRWPRVGR